MKRLAPRDAVAAADLPTWNLYGPETPGSSEVCFFMEPAGDAEGNTQALLHNSAATQGVSLKFNTRQLPCFSLWKNREAACDGYVTGLEPATNFPNIKSFEKHMGRVVELGPGPVAELRGRVGTAGRRGPRASGRRGHCTNCNKCTPAEILAQPDPRWSK